MIEDIRDIRGPIALPEPVTWWPLALAIVAALVAIAALVVLARRRRKPMTPLERALAGLDAAREQLERGDAHQFAVAISATVRAYVEQAFAVRAPSRTTEELLRDLMNDRSPVAGHRAELGAFLDHCDLAKYARWSLTSEQMTAMLDSARAFVRATAAAPSVPRARPTQGALPQATGGLS